MSINNYEIGIVDTRAVIKALSSLGYEFRDYALTAFKHRLEHVIALHALKNADGLIAKLLNSPEFIDQFLYDVIPTTTEMFRDPSFWRALRDEVFPELLKTNRPKIWLAALDSGEELFSIAIALKEHNLLDKVQLFANYNSDKRLAQIKAGLLDARNMETNEANYLRMSGHNSFGSYYTTQGHTVVFDPQLVANVTFLKQKTDISETTGAVKLALFRNRIIYHNHFLQERNLQTITNCLTPGGFLALGIKETIENTNTNNKFTVFNENEKLYKRKLT